MWSKWRENLCQKLKIRFVSSCGDCLQFLFFPFVKRHLYLCRVLNLVRVYTDVSFICWMHSGYFCIISSRDNRCTLDPDMQQMLSNCIFNGKHRRMEWTVLWWPLLKRCVNNTKHVQCISHRLMHDNLYTCMSATSDNGVCHTEIGLSINVSVVHPSYSSITYS